jgi:hypothetical protein
MAGKILAHLQSPFTATSGYKIPHVLKTRLRDIRLLNIPQHSLYITQIAFRIVQIFIVV